MWRSRSARCACFSTPGRFFRPPGNLCHLTTVIWGLFRPMMICAECGRCGRRSILSQRSDTHEPQLTSAPAEPVTLRCDLCGSRRVQVVEFDSPYLAMAFVAKRGSGR